MIAGPCGELTPLRRASTHTKRYAKRPGAAGMVVEPMIDGNPSSPVRQELDEHRIPGRRMVNRW